MDGPKNLNILEYSEKINNKYNNYTLIKDIYQ